jgi:hypothetical protein
MNSVSAGGWTGGFVEAAEANLEQLSSRGPWISLLDPEAELGHFVIVDELGPATASIRDPRGGAYEMTHSDARDGQGPPRPRGAVRFGDP